MDTVLTDKYIISGYEVQERNLKKISDHADVFWESMNALRMEIKEKSEGEKVLHLDNGCILFLDNFLIMKERSPIGGSRILSFFLGSTSDGSVSNPYENNFFKKLEMFEIEYINDFREQNFLKEHNKVCDMVASLPLLQELHRIRDFLYDSDENSKQTKKYIICKKEKGGTVVLYNPSDRTYQEQLRTTKDSSVYAIAVARLVSKAPEDILFDLLLKHNLIFKELSLKSRNFLKGLKEFLGDFYNKSNANRIKIKGNDLLRELDGDSKKYFEEKLYLRLLKFIENIEKKKGSMNLENIDYKELLLNCEKYRADIEPYEERILTDPNRGHWDLWTESDKDCFTYQMEECFYARNPKVDLNEDGVIAIDFGTKSTIVVYQSDIEHSLPMGIGDGNLSEKPNPFRYENPTVMHFVDISTFLSAYRSSKGRPNTKWEDLTISHTALEQFSTSKSEAYYEYLHRIKQWAGQRGRKFRIKSYNGESFALPEFLELKEDDINPIEIYAYYIGLYINNMRKGHGIFLDYYLSFPVTYDKKIRQKIIESFEKGLKKSLPEAILNDEELMKRFCVNGEISEPAAYAVCALQEYGFDPKGDEEVFYGIFDFGGGTTDFDFGIWKESRKRRYDYTIENFGANGDPFLGGENLLEMLAFEIFKENQDMMRENGYTFTLAPKCTEFIGSDALLSDSQEAEKNMHNLMKILRPFWENNSCFEDEKEEISEQDGEDKDSIILKVDLFNKEGEDYVNEPLSFSRREIYCFIEDKIREGVKNFFSALVLSFQNDKARKFKKVNILLAGNSCKSPIVKKVFKEEIAEQTKLIREKMGIASEDQELFEVFPPLGTEDAYKKMDERGVAYNKDDAGKPTGKTGVAFGLIQCRKGGRIERIADSRAEDEIPFQYFLGWNSKGKFELFKDEMKSMQSIGKPDYNEWYQFIEADASVFYIFYTSLPECVSGEIPVEGNPAIKRIKCHVDHEDENAYVYIRACDPYSLEYVVAKDQNVENSKLGEIIKKELR